MDGDGGQQRIRNPRGKGGRKGGGKADDGYSESGYAGGYSGRGRGRGGGNAMSSGASGGNSGGRWNESFGGGYQSQSAASYGFGGGEDMSNLWSMPTPFPARNLIWSEYKSEDGTPYYYNSHTGLTQWDRPAELEPPKPVPESRNVNSNEQRDRNRQDKQGRGNGDNATGDFSGGVGDRENMPRRGNNDRGDTAEGGDRGRNRRRGGGQGGRGGGGGARDGGQKQQEDAAEFGPPGCNLFVFHLPDDWADDDLNTYFAPHGTVISAKVMKEVGTGRSRGFGFVSYEDRQAAATAIKKMQGYKILGKRLKVEFKKGEQGSAAFDTSVTDALGSSLGELGENDDSGPPKKHYPDDERLIGYLRAISSKSGGQTNKDSEPDIHSKTKLQKEAAAAAAAAAGDEED